MPQGSHRQDPAAVRRKRAAAERGPLSYEPVELSAGHAADTRDGYFFAVVKYDAAVRGVEPAYPAGLQEIRTAGFYAVGPEIQQRVLLPAGVGKYRPEPPVKFRGLVFARIGRGATVSE